MTIIVELVNERLEVRTPNLLGAIVAKSAAVTGIVSATRFEREKHERVNSGLGQPVRQRHRVNPKVLGELERYTGIALSGT